jgi:hypothetical protein
VRFHQGFRLQTANKDGNYSSAYGRRVSGFFKPRILEEHPTLQFNRFTKKSSLEILNSDQQWVEVQIPRYSFVLLPGRLLEFMSKGKVKAIVHRVKQINNNERLTVNFNYGVPEKLWQMYYQNTKLSDFYFGSMDDKYKVGL